MAEDKNPEKLEVIPIEDTANPSHGSPYAEIKEDENAQLFRVIRGKDNALLTKGAHILLIVLAIAMVIVVLFVFWWLFKDFAP